MQAEAARLGQLFELASAFLAIHVGPHHVALYINRLLEKRLPGRPLLGRPLREAMPELESQGIFEMYDRVYRTGEPAAARELSVVRARGGTEAPETRYFNASLQPWRAPDGTIWGVLSVAFEVTEQVRARERLRESEQRFRVLADAAPVMIWITGPDKLVTYFNREWLDLTGRTPEQELGDGWASGVHPEDRDHCVQAYRSAFDARQRYRMEYRIEAADGTYRWLLSHGVPHVTPDGVFLGYIGSSVDITERKLWEQALRDSEERLRFTLEAAQVGTWQWDMASGRVEWSDNLEAIHGLPRGSFRGDFKSFLADVHPDDRAKVTAAIQKAAADGGPYRVEYRLPERDRTERWVEGQGRTFADAAGRPMRMAGICMDITERKRAERTLEMLLREQQHRVKNTLAVVQSLASQTARSSLSLADFTDAFQGRLRSLSRAHDALAETRWEGAELRDLLLAALSPWRDRHGERLRLRGEPLLLAPQAALALGMIFHELATNAVKYGALASQGGCIEVGWQVEPHADGERLILTWSETGGPQIRAPGRRGFGTRLIERSVAHELGGEASLSFDAPGLSCVVRVPLRPATVQRTG